MKNIIPPSDPEYLDLARAKEIKKIADENNVGCSILNLSAYSKADLSAIEYLSKYPYDFVTLGIRNLNPELARLLGCWINEPYLMLEELETLDKESAKELCQGSINLDLKGMDPIPLEIAEELIKIKGNLGLAFDNISLGMAQILKKHSFSLSLILLNEPSIEVAIELGQHQGHELFIYRLANKPSHAFLDALIKNRNKAITFGLAGSPPFCIELRTVVYAAN